MTKPKPPRVLNYDEECGYIVAGTHDTELALTLILNHLHDIEHYDDVEISSLLEGCRPAKPIWMRCSMANLDGDHAWMREDTEPNARGAFPAIVWERKW